MIKSFRGTLAGSSGHDVALIVNIVSSLFRGVRSGSVAAVEIRSLMRLIEALSLSTA